MKMIARMFCAAALVIGAVSLTGCDKDAPKADAKGTNTVAQAAKETAKDAKAAAADAKAAAKDVKDAVKK